MAEHKPGEMDIAEHEKTFEGFVKGIAIVATLSLLALIFMALVNS